MSRSNFSTAGMIAQEKTDLQDCLFKKLAKGTTITQVSDITDQVISDDQDVVLKDEIKQYKERVIRDTPVSEPDFT